MLQTKGNRLLCSLNIWSMWSQSWLDRLVLMTTSKKLVQNGKEATYIYIYIYIYIFGCLILFPYILNLVFAMLDTYSQLMVIAKAQNIHHSTVYDHHDCMRPLKIWESLLQWKCYLKSVTEIIFSTERKGNGNYASKVKELGSS